MAKKALVIVESPSKAKTIQKYLGRQYAVKASVGHIKDLPKSKLGVDPDKGFKTDYQVIPSKVKVIAELKKAAKGVPELYLATDPDREGEAIAWHIHQELKGKGKTFHRVLFNAITKPSVLEAMNTPLDLDINKYNSQQARRILDRLVGYKISPLLWDKVKRGLSAGRVQSVALRLVVDREAEIKAFKPEEYWKLKGTFFSKADLNDTGFDAMLFKINGKDPELSNKDQVSQLLKNLEGACWKISSIEQKERSRKPYPPFITSRLQQEGATKLGFTAKRTMGLAQKLYEGVDLGDLGTHGLITYMRTDSVRIDPAAIQSVRQHISEQYGAGYLPAEPNQYKSKKTAQEAHEAIRPASLDFTPERVRNFLEKDEFKLYQLIWNRFVSSQMTPATYDQTAVDISATDKAGQVEQFRATGSVMKFSGFTAVYTSSVSEGQEAPEPDEKALKLPKIKTDDEVENRTLTPSQHFTQSAPRYNDASLIRDLEEKGIGRPSTFATILSNLQDREYVEKREARYYPSELGTVVTNLLIQSFPDILDAQFTAAMENQLDAIEEGKADWKKILANFWTPFEKTLEEAKKQMKDIKRQEVPTDILCERCNATMMIKWGKLGSFLACSNYPECKNTQDFKKDDDGKIVIVPKEFTDKNCEKCSKPMIVKSGKFGKFLACSDYPNCKVTQPFTIGIPCPDCKEGEIALRQSRFSRVFYSCNRWPKCNYALWYKPVQKPCPDCGSPVLIEKKTKATGPILKCPNKECSYFEHVDLPSEVIDLSEVPSEAPREDIKEESTKESAKESKEEKVAAKERVA